MSRAPENLIQEAIWQRHERVELLLTQAKGEISKEPLANGVWLNFEPADVYRLRLKTALQIFENGPIHVRPYSSKRDGAWEVLANATEWYVDEETIFKAFE